MLQKNNSESNQKIGATCLAFPKQENFSDEDICFAVI